MVGYPTLNKKNFLVPIVGINLVLKYLKKKTTEYTP